MLVLGIESSCDETAVAVVSESGVVLSDIIASQIDEHRPYGGVVPELASRAHLNAIGYAFEQALSPIKNGLNAIDAIAVTHGPGLTGALLVGVQFAKALAFARGLALIGVDHLNAHLLAVHLQRDGENARVPAYPFIGLLVSGGHTALYEVASPTSITMLGQTRDDAAGECYDKVAKLLGLGYPGGPVIDKLAALGDPKAFALPSPLYAKASLEFSFSGLKTAVSQHVNKNGIPQNEQTLADFCASFQRVVVDVLVRKSLAACEAKNISRLVLAGGVAANRGLRASAVHRGEKRGVEVFLPSLASCTDNAAMIAYAGAQKFLSGARDDMTLGVYSRTAENRRGKPERVPHG